MSIEPRAAGRCEDVVGRAPRSAVDRLVCAARVRWTPRKLDRQLADGRSPWSSGALTVRAARLSSREERRRLASSIVALVRLAEYRRPATPYLRIRHGAVVDEREALLGLAARLDAEEPVEVATVAQLALLVWDAKSPVYERGRPVDEIAAVVRRCARTAGG